MRRDLVVLNVGGMKFHTTMDTLSNAESSMLRSMVSGNWVETEDSNEEIFIDRDGTYFRYILNWFRSRGSMRQFISNSY